MSKAKTYSSITRKELADAIYRTVTTISHRDSRRIVDEVFDEIEEALLRNEPVHLRGFGVFKVQHKKERIGRNPKNGIDAIITPRRVIKFSANTYVRALVNGEPLPNKSDEREA
jgi:integration host factor subunit alpha